MGGSSQFYRLLDGLLKTGQVWRFHENVVDLTVEAETLIPLTTWRPFPRRPDTELQRVNIHIASCSECEEWLQAEIAQTAAIRSWPSKIRKIEKAAKKKRAQG